MTTPPELLDALPNQWKERNRIDGNTNVSTVIKLAAQNNAPFFDQVIYRTLREVRARYLEWPDGRLSPIPDLDAKNKKGDVDAARAALFWYVLTKYPQQAIGHSLSIAMEQAATAGAAGYHAVVTAIRSLFGG